MQSSNAWLLILLASVSLLAACANTSHVITGKPRAAIDPAQVTLYTAPSAKYEEIAVIDASSQMSFAFGDQNKMDAVIARLKKEAASLGANGVFLQGTGSSGAGGVGTGVGARPAAASPFTYRPIDRVNAGACRTLIEHSTGFPPGQPHIGNFSQGNPV